MNPEFAILVVDDEDAVRDYARFVLESQGYRVLTARNSVEALLLSQQHDGRIRLLITDLTMPPYMDGESLAHALRGPDPDLRILFLAARGDTPPAAWCSAASGVIHKPFTPEMLVRGVRGALAGPAPSPIGEEPGIAVERSILMLVSDGEVRSSVAGLLRREGYAVLESRNIGEALRVCEWHTGRVGILLAERDLLDSLPGELKERLAEVRPDMRILAASVSGAVGRSLGDRVRLALEEWGLEAGGRL